MCASGAIFLDVDLCFSELTLLISSSACRYSTGADPGREGRTRGAARAPPKIGKNMIFWHKIVIFHTKYPKQISRLPPLGAIFLSAPPLT